MKSFRIFLKGIRQMVKFEPMLLPLTLLISIFSALRPFINIYFSSKIIADLISESSTKKIMILVASSLGLNFLLHVVNSGLQPVYSLFRNRMYEKERLAIEEKLFRIHFAMLENSDFQELVHMHNESMSKIHSSFFYISNMIKEFTAGTVTLICACTLLTPLIKIGLTNTGYGILNSPWFFVIIVVVISVSIGVILVLSLRTSKLWFQSQEQYGKLNRLFHCYRDILADYKSGKEVRLYNQKDLIEREAVSELLVKGKNILSSAANKSALSSSYIAIIGTIIAFGIYVFIGVKGLLGLFEIDALVRYTGAFMQVVSGVTSIAVTLGKNPELIPNLEYFFKIIETKNEMKYGEKEVDLTFINVEFKNVYFKYPSMEEYILKDISLKIEFGEKLAIVGRNGSGKTTFIKLLCRLYDVDEGEILINGVNIKDLTEDCCRMLFSVVFQDFKLFSLLLDENICAGEDVNEKIFWKVVDEVEMKENVVNLPYKEKTYLYKDINNEGIDVSGGEAQKLALARALYKNAPVILLDEPTAALDPVAEYNIYEQFNKIIEGKTAIYISHRLSSCKFCDKIAVFKNGEIVQFGNHDELLKEDESEYGHLWKVQASWYLENRKLES